VVSPLRKAFKTQILRYAQDDGIMQPISGTDLVFRNQSLTLPGPQQSAQHDDLPDVVAVVVGD